MPLNGSALLFFHVDRLDKCGGHSITCTGSEGHSSSLLPSLVSPQRFPLGSGLHNPLPRHGLPDPLDGPLQESATTLVEMAGSGEEIGLCTCSFIL